MNITLERLQKAKARTSGHYQRPNKKAQTEQTCRVEFQLYDPQAREVFLAGTFNQWNASATPMLRQPEGKWTKVLTLRPGRYEYKFVVDGNWRTDPMSWQAAANPFDGYNSVLDVHVVQG